jgi:hypothetical protein
MKFELQTFNRDVTDEELLQDLASVHAKLTAHGKRLTFRSYGDVGKYSAQTVAVRFGSWNDGVRKAGLAPSEERDVPVEALFDNLKLVWIAKGKQPVFRDMKAAPSRYTATTYSDRFGGWRKALETFIASIDHEQSALPSREVEASSGSSIRDVTTTTRDPSLALRFFVLKRDRFTCVACGRSPATVAGLVLEIDHIIAWSRGGRTVTDNLRTLCYDCNRGKGAT